MEALPAFGPGLLETVLRVTLRMAEGVLEGVLVFVPETGKEKPRIAG